MSRLPNGAIIGPYKIAERISGDGGTRGSSGQFGMVYFARPVRGLGQPVAIKEFFPTQLVRRGRGNMVVPHDDAARELFAQGLAEFEREAEFVDALDHPNVGHILGFVEKNGTAYIISEWLKETLAHRVGKRGTDSFTPLTVDELRPLLDQLLDGLERIHAGRVLHRDIKPSNIMFRDRNTPVFIDFGAARQLTAAATQQLTAILTPGYAPYEQYVLSEEELGEEFDDLTPEMLENLPKQGPWTDIYALAATCHYALTGETPGNALMRKYHGRSYRSLVTRVAGEPAEGPERTRWRHFLRQIDRALALEPRDRFQSAAEWRAVIEKVGEEPPPPPPPLPPTPPSPGNDKTVPWIVGGVIAVAAIAGIVASNQPRHDYSVNTAEEVSSENLAINDTMTMNVDSGADNIATPMNTTVADDSTVENYVETANVTAYEPPTPQPTRPAAPNRGHRVYMRNDCSASLTYYVEYGSEGGRSIVGPYSINANTHTYLKYSSGGDVFSTTSLMRVYAYYNDGGRHVTSYDYQFWYLSKPDEKFEGQSFYPTPDSDGDYNIVFPC